MWTLSAYSLINHPRIISDPFCRKEDDVFIRWWWQRQLFTILRQGREFLTINLMIWDNNKNFFNLQSANFNAPLWSWWWCTWRLGSWTCGWLTLLLYQRLSQRIHMGCILLKSADVKAIDICGNKYLVLTEENSSPVNGWYVRASSILSTKDRSVFSLGPLFVKRKWFILAAK